MSDVQSLLGEKVYVQLSGENYFEGILTDYGKDVLVLYNGQKYYYIPWFHVHRVNLSNNIKDKIDHPINPSIAEDIGTVSYRKILMNAKGIFAEIYVTGNITFHGYITNVLSDYIVFYSPVFKMLYISLSHLKWLTPYNHNANPYNAEIEILPVNPSNMPFSRLIESQLKKEQGKFVVFDGGLDPMKIGLLKRVEDGVIELVAASGEVTLLRLNHIKSYHTP
ncbi:MULTISPECIES: DUF2642 domain-containing protein [unclassified Bacillus (in: firmicutes)]|uniref:DUF2642 domain-containing protein n=1 Tax=unclassified Bacillus (in: firmicutes) TaxID=185979 RepID=UPI000BF14F9C|nr:MULTISPECIES: DUF2642 domain-containing protein [unclassified Bacillus (in: firmicutes)]PEJ53117.1 DUF2642 domain-containing protein [Bacillus sp. AFS002410]PEL13712.1 DUF2642 domain-containing protein [Bacillus sp. AFS017336]